MVQIFSNGSVSLCGVRCLKECEVVAKHVLSRIKRACYSGKDGVQKYAVNMPDTLDIHSPLKIDVVKVEFDLKAALKLDVAHRILAEKHTVSYQPELFHALKVSVGKNATVAIYSSGKAFINLNAAKCGGDSAELMHKVNEVYTEVCGFLWRRIAEVINLSYCKPSKDVASRT
jgi:TATA-box binding protein (TBP) (component of TFIID and TFIIIB)